MGGLVWTSISGSTAITEQLPRAKDSTQREPYLTVFFPAQQKQQHSVVGASGLAGSFGEATVTIRVCHEEARKTAQSGWGAPKKRRRVVESVELLPGRSEPLRRRHIGHGDTASNPGRPSS